MAFPKMILLSVRQAITNMNQRHISELKSYKKPPKSIHQIVKAALYVFGAKPKEGNWMFDAHVKFNCGWMF
jgi:hypothetical protein